MIEIKYGRISREGKIVGYAVFETEGKKIELISEPYGPLRVLINGKENNWAESPSHFDLGIAVQVWTKVAGWIGTEQMARVFK